jgi:hypothetical protein
MGMVMPVFGGTNYERHSLHPDGAAQYFSGIVEGDDAFVE